MRLLVGSIPRLMACAGCVAVCLKQSIVAGPGSAGLNVVRDEFDLSRNVTDLLRRRLRLRAIKAYQTNNVNKVVPEHVKIRRYNN